MMDELSRCLTPIKITVNAVSPTDSRFLGEDQQPSPSPSPSPSPLQSN